MEGAGAVSMKDPRSWKSLLICPSKTLRSDLAAALGSVLPLAPVEILAEYPGRGKLAEALRSFDPRLCFLECGAASERGLAVLADLTVIAPQLPVIAVLGQGDSDLLLRCLRKGATDFLMTPVQGEQVRAVVEKIARRQPAGQRETTGAQIVATVPAKGACGASTLAMNLVFQARKLGLQKALLADLDALTGVAGFQLKIKSAFSFLEVLNRPGGMEEDMWRQLVTRVQGIDVLLAPENMIEGLDSLRDANPILDFAAGIYELIVADCGSAYGAWNLSIVQRATAAVLVTTNELPALEAAQRVLSYWEDRGIDIAKVRLVVNRYKREVGVSEDLIGRALGCEVFAIIPSDYESVQNSLMEGRPIAGSGAVGKALAELTRKLIGAAVRAAQEEKKQAGGLFARFRKASVR